MFWHCLRICRGLGKNLSVIHALCADKRVHFFLSHIDFKTISHIKISGTYKCLGWTMHGTKSDWIQWGLFLNKQVRDWLVGLHPIIYSEWPWHKHCIHHLGLEEVLLMCVIEAKFTQGPPSCLGLRSLVYNSKWHHFTIPSDIINLEGFPTTGCYSLGMHLKQPPINGVNFPSKSKKSVE